jgi:hypothetical protein
MLDAISSTSERDLEFFKPENCSELGTQVCTEVAPQKIKENREERRKTKAAAKNAPPADPRFQPFVDFAFEAFEQKHGQKPTWCGKHFKALSAMLASNKGLSADELQKRFTNFIGSTESFTQKQGDSLAYFCSHIDSFLTGPILERSKPNGSYGAKASTVETTLAGYEQLQQTRAN